MIRFLCPRCKAVLDQPENAAGTKMPCPSCGQRLQVPLPPENKTVLGAPLGTDVPLTPSAVPAALPPGGAAPQPEIPAPVASSTHVQVRLVMGREHLFWPCPYCQNSVDVPQDLGQMSVRCPHCAKKIEVPYPGGMPRRAAPPPPPPVNRPAAPLPPEPPPRPRYDDDHWDRRPPRRDYDDDDRYPRERPRASRARMDHAIRSAVSGLICSMIGLGLLLIAFFIWVLSVQSMKTSTNQNGLLCILALVVGGSFVLSLLGTIFSSRGLYPENEHNRGAAVAGLVCGIIGLVISSLVGFILFIAIMVNLNDPRWR
jgi:DNA-directed RNA polymerase subunit RPC12/RpoP